MVQELRATSSKADISSTENNARNSVFALANEKIRSDFASFVDRQEKKCPRTYNLLFFVFIPILLLICWCMFCGHFLAVLERKNEMNENDTAISAFLDEYKSMRQKLKSIEEAYEDCHEKYMLSSPPSDLSNMKSFMEDCSGGSTTDFLLEFEQEKLETLKSEGLSFNWNTCDPDRANVPSEDQAEYVISRWNETAENALVEYKASTPLEDQVYSEMYEIVDKAYETSSIPEDACYVNSSGGSIFWFTVMTTIGYGNTAPVTKEGIAFVALLGFISILAFTAVSGAAGYVTLAIVDDFFIRRNMQRLTKGWTSVIFWLFNLLISMCLLGAVKALYAHTRDEVVDPYSRDVWFAYTSITTIGFGDIYIPHETVSQRDMFYLPFPMLLGFVCLANFLIKFSEKIVEVSQKTGLTDDESLGLLLQQSRSMELVPENVDVAAPDDDLNSTFEESDEDRVLNDFSGGTVLGEKVDEHVVMLNFPVGINPSDA